MAKMIPSTLANNTVGGERDVFNKLKTETVTHDWIVLHSYFLEEHATQVSGEVDFIIFVPYKGIVVVEVKSNPIIEYDSGWQNGKKETIKDPFRQANDNMHTLRRKIDHENVPKELKTVLDLNTVFTNVVIFPKAKFDSNNLKEYKKWRLCDRDRFNKGTLADFILNALDEELNHLHNNGKNISNQQNLTKRLLLNCVQELRPQLLNSIENLDERNSRILEELDEFTAEQKNTLEELEINPRALIKGGAGTGKTSLAMEICDQSAQKGKKAIYLCFNSNLKTYLKQKYGNLEFEIMTYHGLLEKFTEIIRPTSEEDKDHYYREILPQSAYEGIADLEDKYDTIVVDEFQDLISQDNLIILNSLLNGGLAGGNWVFLGDFMNQTIYKKNFDLEEIISEYLGFMPPIKIFKINCRNTPSTVKQLYKWTDAEKYHQIIRPENSLMTALPEMSFPDDEFQIDSISKILDILISDGYSVNEILFLTPFNDSIVQKFNNEQTKYSISEYKVGKESQSEGPYHGTIASFKGLEFNVVVVLDVKSDINPDYKEIKKLIYTGVSRSLDLSVLLTDDILYGSLNDRS